MHIMHFWQNHALYVKNVIIFIIRVLKLLVMQGKYILLALIVVLITFPPAGASLNKIAAGAPVFIGESNVDLTSALDNCRIIAWWPAGSDTSRPAAKNITLRPLNEISPALSHYTFTPAEYGGYNGTWYCEEKKPLKAVFSVLDPQVRIRVWDLSNDVDVTGTTVLSAANVTYRIDTNLNTALQLKYRPDLTPADTFWSVKLFDPAGRSFTNIYTGSSGAPDTVILTLDNTPFISSSPYYWGKGTVWNRASRGPQGDFVYPPGKYLFTASQNLNGMQGTYKSAGITNVEGKLTSSADVTFLPYQVITQTPTPAAPVSTPEATLSPEVTGTTTLPEPASTPEPVKTTYAAVPVWLALAGLGVAAALIVRRMQ
jgi:hypothetical protein